MKGWIRKTIGEICDKGNGQVKTGPFGSQLHESDYQEFGTPVIMPTDIIGGKISTKKIARVSDNHVERLYKHKLSVGDIVYGRRGDIGRQALIRFENIGWLCGTGCLRLSLGSSIVIPEFLHWYLATKNVIGWIEGQAVGATMPNLNTAILRRVPIYFPECIKTQKKIAAILSAYDELIENNKRRIALLEKIAEELYREWFVRLRFPGYQKAKFEKGMPMGWFLIKVDKAFNYMGGGTPSKEIFRYWQAGTINWYTPTDITASKGIFMGNSKDMCTEEGFNNSSAKMFPAYSIMMTSRATIGAFGISLVPACTNQGFISCIPNERYPLSFLYHWLKLNKAYFELLSGGTTFLELTKGTFKRMEILTPPKDIVLAYDKLAAPILDMIEKLIIVNRNVEKSRDMLLPRLISGKLSVENLDIHFPPSMQEVESTEKKLMATDLKRQVTERII